MIGKIKGLMETEERLRLMHKALTEQHESIGAHSELLKQMKKQGTQVERQMSLMEEGYTSIQKRLETQLDGIEGLRERLKEEVGEMKILKSTLRERIVNDILQEVREEIVLGVDRLKTDVRAYNELKNELRSIHTEMATMKEEFKKFITISKHIREADFELTNHAKRLASADREKVELLKKVDSLQRLLGKERRDRRQ